MGTTSEFQEAWNLVAMTSGWHACQKMTKARTQQLYLRMKDEFWRESWRAALDKASPVPGLRGQNERGWRANVDWFLRPGTVVKIMEGVYDAWGPKQTVLAGVPSQDQTAKKIAESKEYSQRAFEEWQAKGGVPKLKRD